MKRNFEFDVNKKCSTAIWVTLYFTVRAHKTAYDSENEGFCNRARLVLELRGDAS